MCSGEQRGVALPRDPYDALRLENDLLGVRIWGRTAQPTLSVGRADIWDRRWFGDRQPAVTLKQIRRLAMSDELHKVAPSPNRTVYGAYGRYVFPCPKPGVQIILGTPFAASAAAEATTGGDVSLSMKGNGKSLLASVWVPLRRPLVVVELESDCLDPSDFWVRVYRHRDTIVPGEPLSVSKQEETAPRDFEQLPPPRCWHSGPHWGVTQAFAAEATFPRGFSFLAAATVVDLEPSIECIEEERGLGTPLWAPQQGRISHGIIKRYTPINEATGAAATARFERLAESFAIIATIATTQDGPDPIAVARRTLDAACEIGVEGLRQEESEALRQARRKHHAFARVDGAVRWAAPPVVRPKLRQPDGYYGDVPLCSVDSTKLCFQDYALWHADFHLNEIRAEPMLTLGQFEELLPYCEMIRGLLPQAQENARDVYDLPGAMYPLVHFPLRCRGIAHTNLTWEQDMGINGLVSKPLWLYYTYTGDTEFLRDLAWPVLSECARFMMAYLTEEPDGRLHVVPTVSPEHWGLTARFERNRDCLSALTLTRYLLIAAAAAARILGQDSSETSSWRTDAERLAPYPTYETPAGPVWVDVAGAPPIEYNIPVPLAAVFWGDEVGLDSPPELLDVARQTLEQIQVWQPHRFYLDACVRPRLGIWRPGAALGPENLLLSYQSIQVFPAVPPATEIVMRNFAAQGGFRVSAIRTPQGNTRGIQIRSMLGEVCRIANPWPDSCISVTTIDGIEVTRTTKPEKHVSVITRAGGEYRLRPV